MAVFYVMESDLSYIAFPSSTRSIVLNQRPARELNRDLREVGLQFLSFLDLIN